MPQPWKISTSCSLSQVDGKYPTSIVWCPPRGTTFECSNYLPSKSFWHLLVPAQLKQFMNLGTRGYSPRPPTLEGFWQSCQRAQKIQLASFLFPASQNLLNYSSNPHFHNAPLLNTIAFDWAQFGTHLESSRNGLCVFSLFEYDECFVLVTPEVTGVNRRRARTRQTWSAPDFVCCCVFAQLCFCRNASDKFICSVSTLADTRAVF